MREIRTGDERWGVAQPVEWEWAVSSNGNPTTILPDGTRLIVFKNKFKDGYTWMTIKGEEKRYDKLVYADIEECKRMALRMQDIAQPPPAIASETPAMTQKIDTTIRAGERRIRL